MERTSVVKSETLAIADRSVMAILPWVIISLGIVLRLRQFLFNRSLSFDESLVALNIIERSFLELAKPLDYKATAPIGFLMIEKLLVYIFGDHEYVLRFLPFFAGVISLLLFYEVAKRCVGLKGVIIALGLFALSDPLIYYSTELKQYSSDVTIGLFLCLIGISLLRQETLSYRVIVSSAIVGPTLILFSYPAVFTLAGIGVTLIAAALRDHSWKKLSQLLGVFLFWLLGFSTVYLLFLHSLANNDYFVDGWQDLGGFMPLVPSSLTQIRWFASNFFEIFRYPAGLALSGIGALAFLAGSTAFMKDKRRMFLMLISPIIFTLLASGLHKYPFSGRLILFIVPALLIVIGKGIEWIVDKTWSTAPIVAVATTALLFFHPLFYAGHHLLHARTVEELRPVIEYLAQRRQNGDVFYLYYGAEYIFKYYQKKHGFADGDYILGIKSRKYFNNYVADLERLRGNKRVWVVFSHNFSARGIDEELFFLFNLDRMGTRVDAFKSIDAAAYLYDLTPRDELKTPPGTDGLPIDTLRQSHFRE